MADDMSACYHDGPTLILGPANSGKIGRVLRWWEERLPKRAVLVAPTGPDARRLSLRMARRTRGLVGQDPALTFDGLVRLILSRSPHYATDFERALIAARLLRDTELEGLASLVHLPGASVALARLLEQLGQSGKDPGELDKVLARWGATDPQAGSLSRDIRKLVKGYVQALAGLALSDRPSVVREAIPRVPSWDRPVALYGFTSFTEGQRLLIEELSGRVDVLVAFTHDPAKTLNLTTPDEMSWWRSRAGQIIEVEVRTRAYTSESVAYLDRFFMDEVDGHPQPPPASSEGRGVQFLLASGRRAEAELAAEKIADLLRGGLAPGEIGVVVRHVRQWSGLLARVFDSCNIPCRIDDRRTLRETGLGHAFLKALQAVVRDDAEALLTYLRSPYSGVTLEETADLELIYRRGVSRGARAVAEICESLVPGPADLLCPVSRLWEIIEPSTPGPEGAPPSVPDGGPLTFAPMKAEGLVRDMFLSSLRRSLPCSRAAEEDARAFQTLRAALTAITGMVGEDASGVSKDVSAEGSADRRTSDPENRRVYNPENRGTCDNEVRGSSTLLDPVLILRSLAQAVVFGGEPENDDAVQVLSVQRARARRFQAVFVLGLVDGEFPGPTDSPSLLSSAQRARLDRVGGGGILPIEIDQEAALFASAISRPWRLLFLSARDAEDDGSECVPSHYWQSAQELFGLEQSGCAHRTLADQVFAPDRASSRRHYLRACAACGRAPHPATAGAQPSAAPRRWVGPPTQLTHPIVLDELRSAECFSPSDLEAYASCPFRWFVERVIGAQELDAGLDNRVVGELLHRVLSMTYQELSAAGLLPLHAESVEEAKRTAYALIDELTRSEECPGSPAERRLTARRLQRLSRNVFLAEASARSSLVLSETEMWIGGRHGIDVGDLKIRGRIDRVDSTPDGQGLFILDYKSGSIPAGSALGTEDGLQLPLYMMGLAAERPGVEVVGGAYLSARDGKWSGLVGKERREIFGPAMRGLTVLSEEDREELFRTTHEVAGEAVAGMRAGIIAPRADRKCPSWCDLGPVCRAHRGRQGR